MNTVPVIPGVHRSDSRYVWPDALTRPSDVRLVYLDLNHWIYLAKAATGHRDGSQYRGVLQNLRDARSSGRFVFPLSSTHYMEMAGITDPRQRADVAGVMEELSGFKTLLSRSVIMRLEIEAVLDALGKPRAQAYLPVALLCDGSGPAFGVRGGLRFRSPEGDDVTEDVRRQWPAGPDGFDEWLADAELQLERAALRGPADADVEALKAEGWDPTVARTIAEQRADEERKQAARFEAGPRWRQGRLRDVIAARYVFIELNEMLAEALDARGLKLEDVWSDPESARRLVDSMPSADVCVSLMRAAHRNPQTKWTSNDIFDIDALSIAVPYCDVVATEHHARHMLDVEGVPVRCGTKVVARLADLDGVLAGPI